MVVVALRLSACAQFPHDFLPRVLAGTAILIPMEKQGTQSNVTGRAGLHSAGRESGQPSLETGVTAL